MSFTGFFKILSFEKCLMDIDRKNYFYLLIIFANIAMNINKGILPPITNSIKNYF
jgi:hypothetical protein